MANISDYLDWRGDIPFSQDPFNEVDNLILAELAYTDFAGIVPGEDENGWVTIQKACEAFFSYHSDEEIMSAVSSTKVAPYLMKKMIHSRRFGGLHLSGYVNEIDEDIQAQFSALTYDLGDGTYYVAYRGTDNTIIGWKEDFNMAFLYQTAGQLRAAQYLNSRCRSLCGRVRVGGHSKGGNFAVFAAAFCEESAQRKIMEVYSNDGPGFLPQVIAAPGYQRILPKVKSIVPEASIVGMLLENETCHQVVKSSQTGAYQHDAMSWEVLGNEFVSVPERAAESVIFDMTVKKWLMGLSKDDREEFVDILFGILQSTGATTIDELSETRMKGLGQMGAYLSSLSSEQQKMFWEILKKLAVSGGESVKDKVLSDMRSPVSIRDSIGQYFGIEIVKENKNKRKEE